MRTSEYSAPADFAASMALSARSRKSAAGIGVSASVGGAINALAFPDTNADAAAAAADVFRKLRRLTVTESLK